MPSTKIHYPQFTHSEWAVCDAYNRQIVTRSSNIDEVTCLTCLAQITDPDLRTLTIEERRVRAKESLQRKQ